MAQPVVVTTNVGMGGMNRGMMMGGGMNRGMMMGGMGGMQGQAMMMNQGMGGM